MKATILRETVRVAYEKHRQHPMYRRGFCLFSFVVERNKILGVGMNNIDALIPKHFGYNKRPKMWSEKFAPSEHSELAAYRKCRGIVAGKYELINVRLTDGGQLAMSCPCSCCTSWLRANDCVGVHFTTPSGWAKISY